MSFQEESMMNHRESFFSFYVLCADENEFSIACIASTNKKMTKMTVCDYVGVSEWVCYGAFHRR